MIFLRPQGLLAILFIFSFTLAVHGIVHKINFVHQPIPTHARNNHHRINTPENYFKPSKRHEKLFDLQQNLLSQKDAVGRLDMKKNYWMLSNISLGTPPQNFVVEVTTLANVFDVIDKSTNLSRVSEKIPAKHTFDSNASSTFKATNSSSYEFLGNDVLTIGNQTFTNVTFGRSKYVGYKYRYYPLDGTLGLSPYDPYPNEYPSPVVSQIQSQLDKPIVSVWQTVEPFAYGTGVITLGAEDTENCKANWAYVPTAVKSYDFNTHIATMTAKVNGTNVSLSINGTLVVAEHLSQWYHFVPNEVAYLLRNATSAVYNKTTGYYIADCNASVSVTLNIGGSGNSTENTKQLVLDASELILYHRSVNACYVPVYGYKPYKKYEPLYLGMPFYRKHCMAYSTDGKQIGFADVKNSK